MFVPKYSHEQIVLVNDVKMIIIGTQIKWAHNGNMHKVKISQPPKIDGKEEIKVPDAEVKTPILEKTLGYIVQPVPVGGFEGGNVILENVAEDKDGNKIMVRAETKPLYNRDDSTWIREDDIVVQGA
jgi:hypothetical protein